MLSVYFLGGQWFWCVSQEERPLRNDRGIISSTKLRKLELWKSFSDQGSANEWDE